jgi:hypothetical protein
MDSSDMKFAEFILKAHRTLDGLKKCKNSYLIREAVQATTVAMMRAYSDRVAYENSLERQQKALHELAVSELEEIEHSRDPEEWIREFTEQMEDRRIPEPSDWMSNVL